MVWYNIVYCIAKFSHSSLTIKLAAPAVLWAPHQTSSVLFYSILLTLYSASTEVCKMYRFLNLLLLLYIYILVYIPYRCFSLVCSKLRICQKMASFRQWLHHEAAKKGWEEIYNHLQNYVQQRELMVTVYN